MLPPLRVAVNGLDVIHVASHHAGDLWFLCLIGSAWPRRLSAARLASTRITSSGQSSQPSPTSLTRSPENLGPRATPEPTAPRPNTRLTQIQIEQQRLRSRGGQNLTERWARLERSLRGKGGYEDKIDTLVDQAGNASADATRGAASKTNQRTFHGLVLPEKPREPQSDGELTFSFCAVSLTFIGFVQNAACLVVRSACTTCMPQRSRTINTLWRPCDVPSKREVYRNTIGQQKSDERAAWRETSQLSRLRVSLSARSRNSSDLCGLRGRLMRQRTLVSTCAYPM